MSAAAAEGEVAKKQLEFLTGSFFATMDQVWGVEYKRYTASNLAAFRRSKAPAVQVRRRKQHIHHSPAVPGVGPDKKRTRAGMVEELDPYTDTLRGITSCETISVELADYSSTRTSKSDKSTEAKSSAIWPMDISGENQSYLPIFWKDYQIAHILPAGVRDHEEWYEVASAALALPESISVIDKLKATRGYKSVTKKKAKKNLPEEEEGATASVSFGKGMKPAKSGAETTINRQEHTGVVHFVPNKVRMKGKATCWDGSTPAIILLPCMELADAKKWNGEGYKTLVLAGLPKNNDNPPVAYEICSPADCTKIAQKSLLGNRLWLKGILRPLHSKRRSVIACRGRMCSATKSAKSP